MPISRRKYFGGQLEVPSRAGGRPCAAEADRTALSVGR
jgi:hypothetical protein